MTNWYKANSTEKPEEYDLVSSPTTVYQHKGIKQTTVDGADGEKAVTMWEYQERQMSHEEYQAYQADMESPTTKMIMQQLSEIELKQEMMMEE